jgi:hypothetical protein
MLQQVFHEQMWEASIGGPLMRDTERARTVPTRMCAENRATWAVSTCESETELQHMHECAAGADIHPDVRALISPKIYGGKIYSLLGGIMKTS